jgi:5-methylcytosine-specific restriction enzyme A
MTPRREFPKSIKAAAFLRSKGHCERCTVRLYTGHIAYDHIIADAMGGDPVLSNCQVLCSACHSAKTHGKFGDTARVAKAKRNEARHIGAKAASRQPMASCGFAKAAPQNRATRPLTKSTNCFR